MKQYSGSWLSNIEKLKFIKLFLLFTTIGVIFLITRPGTGILQVLVLCVVGWFAIETYINRDRAGFIVKSLALGVFLMTFDFII